MSPQRKFTSREDSIAEAGMKRALDALGISDAAAFRAERPEWLTMLNWFRTMMAKDKARADFWRHLLDLVAKAGVEEGVKWAFRTVAISLVLLIIFVITHRLTIGAKLLDAIMGAG